MYSNVPNKRACTFIVCLRTLIEPKRQTLPEINLHARLFGILEYAPIISGASWGEIILSSIVVIQTLAARPSKI